MTRRTSELSRLKNIGAATEAWLNEGGFSTEAELRDAGAVLAYKIVKHQRTSASLNLLYALDGALQDVHWNALTPERKGWLRQEASAPLSILAGTDVQAPRLRG